MEQELHTLPEHLSSPPVISGVRVTRSLVLCVCFVDRWLSYCTFSFGHCVVCSSSIYGFWLPLWYYQTLLNPATFEWIAYIKAGKWSLMYVFISLRFSYLILELLYFWFSFEYTNHSYDGTQMNALCMGIPTSSWSTICHDRSVVAHWKQAYCAPLPLCVMCPLVTQHSPIIPSQYNHIKFCL